VGGESGRGKTVCVVSIVASSFSADQKLKTTFVLLERIITLLQP
jgi:hypothetical protein